MSVGMRKIVRLFGMHVQVVQHTHRSHTGMEEDTRGRAYSARKMSVAQPMQESNVLRLCSTEGRPSAVIFTRDITEGKKNLVIALGFGGRFCSRFEQAQIALTL